MGGGAPSRRPPSAPPALPEAGKVLARASGENFTVASRLLPPSVRGHLLAIYGFARLVDDVGDDSPGDASALLDLIDADLDRAYEGRVPETPTVRRLIPTIRTFDIPPDPFRRLVAANRQDQVITAYETYQDLLAYCELSANPVGHLVLSVFQATTPERLVLSDAVCTGLQLAEHWQDVAEDLRRGRVYLPAEDLHRFGCTREDLATSRASPALRRLLAFEVWRAKDLLERGRPLVRSLKGTAKVAVAGFVAGGRSALEAIRRARFDVLAGPPRAGRALRARFLVRVLMEE